MEGIPKQRREAWRLASFVVMLLVALPLSRLCAAMPEDVFPQLERLVEDSLRQSPRALRVNLDLLRAEYQGLVSSARLYPSLGASVVYNVQREERRGEWGSGERLVYDVSASYPLFHWGAVSAEAEIGRIQTALSSNSRQEALRLLALQVRSEFLKLIAAKAALRSHEAQLVLRGEEVELARLQVEHGEAPRRAITNANRDQDEQAFTVDRHRESLQQAVRRFCRLTGIAEFTVDDIPDEIPPLKVDASDSIRVLRDDYLANEGWRERASYVAQRLELEREQLRARILRVNQRPKVDLRAGVSQDELAFDTDVSRRSRLAALFVGTRVTWNIFDGFASRGRLRSQQTVLRILEQEASALEDDLKNAVSTAVTDVEFSERALEFAERRYRSAVTAVERERDNQEMGLKSAASVREAEAAELGARVTIFNARADYLNAVAAFYSTILNADPLLKSHAAPTDSP